MPTQPSKTKTTGESTSWLGRLEQLVGAQLGETDQKLEREYADDYEEESVDLPPVIGTSAPTLPPLAGTAQEAFRDTPLTSQLREAEQASATVARVSSLSGVPREVARFLAKNNLPVELKIAPAISEGAVPWTQQTLLSVSEGTADGSACHRRRPAAGADLQRERPFGGRVPAHRRMGRAETARIGGGGLGRALRGARR